MYPFSQNVLRLLLVVVPLCLRFVSGRDVLVAPVSLRQIPFSLIKSRLGSRIGGLSSESSHIIYEVTPEGVLVGHNVNLDLLVDTKPPTVERQGASLSYSFNGNSEVDTFPKAHVRQGKGFTVVYDSEHSSVVNVWSNDIFLEPLDQISYPGVFINTHGSSSVGKNQEFSLVSHDAQIAFEGALEGGLNSTRRQSGSSCRLVEVAVAFDNKFCAMFANSQKRAMAYVQATFNFASFIYERDTCHSIILVHVEAHCEDPSDPYKPLSQYGSMPSNERSSHILEGFQKYWQANRVSVHRDLAYFFSGFEEETGTAGRASISAACGPFGYGWVELGDGPTLVHELGHNLGAPHDSEGIMQGTIMRGAPVFFSAKSISQINEYLTSSRASCIDRAPAKCGSSCPGKCVNNRCVALYDDSTPKGLVPCILLDRLYKCTNSLEYGSRTIHYGDDCPSGFDFLQPIAQKPKERYNVFCCRPPSRTSSQGVIPFTYQFIRLTLSDHTPDVIPFYINTPSDIQDGTLMDTQLVPSCIPPSGSTTTPPTTTTATSRTVTTRPKTTKSTTRAKTTTRAPKTKATTTTRAPKTKATTTTLAPTAKATTTTLPPTTKATTTTLPPTTKATTTTLPSTTKATTTRARTTKTTTHAPTTKATTTRAPTTKTTTTRVRTTKATTRAPTTRTTSIVPPGRCGAGLIAPNTFLCSVATGALSIRGYGVISLRMEQRHGAFWASLYAQGDLRIIAIETKFSMNGHLGKFTGSPSPIGKDQKTVKVYEDAFNLSVPPGAKGCCGSRIYLYLRLRVCLHSRCLSGQAHVSTIVRCGNPCHASVGQVKPFSQTLACPTCKH